MAVSLDDWAALARADVAPLPWPVMAAAALLSALAGWRWPQPGTIAHEAGHAVVAWLVGRRLSGIALHSDTTGVTVTSGRPRGLGLLLVMLAGYPAPLVLSGLLAWLWAAGWAGIGVAVLLGMLAGVLLYARSWFAAAICAASAGAVVGMAGPWWAPGRSVACLAAAALMLSAGVHGVVTAWRVWAQPGQSGSDAEQARQLSHVPQVVWLVVFTAWAAAASAWWVALIWNAAAAV